VGDREDRFVMTELHSVAPVPSAQIGPFLWLAAQAAWHRSRRK
jgi:hypothetical protein